MLIGTVLMFIEGLIMRGSKVLIKAEKQKSWQLTINSALEKDHRTFYLRWSIFIL